jgi:cytochrome d ubiquinol oxidase subunit I
MGVAMKALVTSGMTGLLAQAVPPDLFHARMQMALSLGWHIVVACFGVGFPAMVLFAECDRIAAQTRT